MMRALLLAAAVSAAAAVSIKTFDGNSDCSGDKFGFLLLGKDECYAPPGSSVGLKWACESSAATSKFTFDVFSSDTTCAAAPSASIPGTSGTCLSVGSASYLVDCTNMPVEHSITSEVTFHTTTHPDEPCGLSISCRAGQCCQLGGNSLLAKCDSASDDSLWQASFFQGTTCDSSKLQGMIAGDSAQCQTIGNYSLSCAGGNSPNHPLPVLPSTNHVHWNVSAVFPNMPDEQHATGQQYRDGDNFLFDLQYPKGLPGSACFKGADGKANSFSFNSVTKKCEVGCSDGATCGHPSDDDSCDCTPGNVFLALSFAKYESACPGVSGSSLYTVTMPNDDDHSDTTLSYCFVQNTPVYVEVQNKAGLTQDDLDRCPGMRHLMETVGDDDLPPPTLARYNVLSFSRTVPPGVFAAPTYCSCSH